MPGIPEHVAPFVEGQRQRVVRANLPRDAVLGSGLLGYEAAKQAIPNGQHARIVAVDILWILRMVHPMHRRRVENHLNQRPASAQPGVDEELEREVQADGQDHPIWCKSDERERNPEQPHARDRVGQALPERC
ncbi:hypothetical protein D3C72_1812290 [compost metagenome]